MKTIFKFIFLFIFLKSNAQTYSSLIKDEEINEFMNWNFTENKVRGNELMKTIRNLNVKNVDFTDENFIDDGSSILFTKENNLDSIFNLDDRLFLIEQTQKYKYEIWLDQFKDVKLIDKPKLNSNNQTDKIVYVFSLPLFSVDKSKVLIFEGFFCGILCGGTSYNIYEKKNGSWSLIKKVGEMAE